MEKASKAWDKKGKAQFVVRIPHELLRAIDQEAYDRHWSRNTLIQKILEEAITFDRLSELTIIKIDERIDLFERELRAEVRRMMAAELAKE